MEITRCDFCSESSCEFCHQDIHKLSDSQKEFVNKIKADAIDECKEVVNNILNYYRDEYHFGAIFNGMCNTINDRIEMLKEKNNG